MANRPSRELHSGQELLSFDGPPRIDIGLDFNPEEAERAKQHRMRRRGELAVRANGFVGGFSAATGRLWVPHSGTESAIVVKVPGVAVKNGKAYARQGVFKKYEGNPDVSFARVEQWAYFASLQASDNFRRMFLGYEINAREHYRRIRSGLGPNGEIERDRVEDTSMAINGVAAYLMYLRTFVGAPELLNKQGRRKWPQARHANSTEMRMSIAREYLNELPDHEFTATVAEAYWSERARERYWQIIEIGRRDYERREQYWDKKRYAEKILPIEAYENDPRADEWNYIDDDYID